MTRHRLHLQHASLRSVHGLEVHFHWVELLLMVTPQGEGHVEEVGEAIVYLHPFAVLPPLALFARSHAEQEEAEGFLPQELV